MQSSFHEMYQQIHQKQIDPSSIVSIAKTYINEGDILVGFHTTRTKMRIINLKDRIQKTRVLYVYFTDFNFLLFSTVLIYFKGLTSISFKYASTKLLFMVVIATTKVSIDAGNSIAKASNSMQAQSKSTTSSILQYNATEAEYFLSIRDVQPSFERLVTSVTPMTTQLITSITLTYEVTNNDVDNVISYIFTPHTRLPILTSTISTSYEFINKIRAIRYYMSRHNTILLSDSSLNTTTTTTTTKNNNASKFYANPRYINISIQANNTTLLSIIPESAITVANQNTVSYINDSRANVTRRMETTNEKLIRLASSVHSTLHNFTFGCTDHNLSVADNITTNTWDDLTSIDNRLDVFLSSLKFCLEDDVCPKEDIVLKPNFTLSVIWNKVIRPGERLISFFSPFKFNVSTNLTNFDEGNSTNCTTGYTRFSEDSNCVLKEKYIITMSELWFELGKPAKNLFNMLSSINLPVTNISINCSLYDLSTEFNTEIINSLRNNEFGDIIPPGYNNPTEKPLQNCSVSNISTSSNTSISCNVTSPYKCYQLRQPNNTMLDLLTKYAIHIQENDFSTNCSLYGIYGYPNLTLSEVWDELIQPSTTVLQFLSNITSNLKDIFINCSKYNNEIHSNITLSKIWFELTKSNDIILDILSSIYHQHPNVTVSCYDYVHPVNITTLPIIPLPWYKDPRIIYIAAGSISFLVLSFILRRVCVYCRKYSGVYVPGSETKAREKRKKAREKRKERKAKAYARECKRKGYRDPNRPKRKKKKRKKKKGKLTAEAMRKLEEAAKTEWVLSQIDFTPDNADVAVTAC